MAEPTIEPSIISGLVGAALAAIRGQKSWPERVIGFAVGFCIALWGTAPVIEFFNLKTATYAGGIGFALGYFGMALADGILSSDWAAIIKGRLGGGV